MRVRRGRARPVRAEVGMKDGLKVAAATGAVAVFGFVAVNVLPADVFSNLMLSPSDASAVAESEPSPAASASYTDGVYRATASGKFGDVTVTVTVEDGQIAGITVGSTSESPAMATKAREVVIPQILEQQGVDDIDLATGASCTSQAIVDAVADALSRAVAQ